MRRRVAGLRGLMAGLALGALGLPLLLGLVAWSIVAMSAPRLPVLRIESLRRELGAAVDFDGRDFSVRPGYAPPEGLFLVIVDGAGLVALSNVPGISVGRVVGIDEVAASIVRDPDAMNFFSESIRAEGAERGRYYAWFTRGYRPPRGNPPVFAPLTMIGLVAVALAFGLGVATTLARSVLNLERAAFRIASGDLESEVRVGGIREIEDLARAMDGMRAALREDRDRRARFLASVSHDLRTPLTSIAGYLEAVEDGLASDPATLERYVSIMRGKTRLLEGRIAGLIEFARMETGEWRMGFEPLDLRPFLESLAREAREDAALMGRGLSWELGALGGARVRADRDLLARAVENLVSNAVRYSPEGSAVRLSAAREADGSLRVFLDDEGPGIPPAERERVFEAFVRGSSAREGEGSGLGLYIARSVIRGHGWELLAEEAPGGGGRATIAVPAEAVEAPGGEASP